MSQPAQARSPTLFISYRVEDSRYAARHLFEELQRRYGADRVFLDHQRLGAGANWTEQLRAEARRASVMLVLIGENWLKAYDTETWDRRINQPGDWVRQEIETALSVRSKIIPLILEGAKELTKQSLATVPSLTPLVELQSIPLRHKDWTHDVQGLCTTLERLGFKCSVAHPHKSILTSNDVAQVENAFQLPVGLTPLVHRERELARVCGLLSRPYVRLVTLTGPGGVGKTRLGLQAAAQLSRKFSCRAVFVPLAPVDGPHWVMPAIAQALKVQEAVPRSLNETVTDCLSTRKVLLLLDNFEHVLEAAPTILGLLESCPRLKILITSREALHCASAGEIEFPVPPLEHPEPGSPDCTLETLARYGAVKLFIERARAAKPDLVVSSDNIWEIAEVCRYLDGLPLAIELAAARVKTFPPHAMLKQLIKAPLELPSRGGLHLPQRQQTLRKAIAWSYDLLADNEKALFRRLGVFAGGCTPEAAEDTCDVNADLCGTFMDVIESLIEKNLIVQREDRLGERRVYMLRMIREYACECLKLSNEEPQIGARHTAYFKEFAARARPHLDEGGPQQVAWLDRVEMEHDNVRAALTRALAERKAEDASGICLGVFGYWSLRGHLSEGRQWITAALQLRETEGLAKADLSRTAGWLACSQGDYQTAGTLLEESISLYRAVEQKRLHSHGQDVPMPSRSGPSCPTQNQGTRAYASDREFSREVSRSRARALSTLGGVESLQGNYERAETCLKRALKLFRMLKEEKGVAACECNLGIVAYDQGRYGRAEELWESSLASQRRRRDAAGVALLSNNLGRVRQCLGKLEEAKGHHKDSLTLWRQLGGGKQQIGITLNNMGRLSAREKRYQRAVLLYGAADSLCAAVGAPVLYVLSECADYEDTKAALIQALGQSPFTSLWEQGRAMSMEHAITYALSDLDRCEELGELGVQLETRVAPIRPDPAQPLVGLLA